MTALVRTLTLSLAALLAVALAAPAAQAQAPPPKPTAVPAPAPTRSAPVRRAPSAPQGRILVSAGEAVTVYVDGERKASLGAGESTVVTASLGEHLVAYEAADGSRSEAVVEFETRQRVVRVGAEAFRAVRAAEAQRRADDREAAERAAAAAAAREAEREAAAAAAAATAAVTRKAEREAAAGRWQTALRTANEIDDDAARGAAYRVVFEAAVGGGLDVNARIGDTDNTPLSYAVGEFGRGCRTRSGSVEAVEYLVGRGADVNAKRNGRNTVLHDAVVCGHAEVVEALVRLGANVNASNVGGRTPLDSAFESRKVEILEWFIGHEADVNARNSHGNTMLHIAAMYFRVETVEWLIGRGADVNAKNVNDETPLDYADQDIDPRLLSSPRKDDWIARKDDVMRLLRAAGGRSGR